jgi:phosphoribosylamine--glycine ligase
MSKFRLISKSGDGIALAHKIKQEGHDVDFYLEDEHGPNLYKGILDRVPNWQKGINKDMVLIWDMCDKGKDADKLKAAGYKVFGASEIADKLELDRAFGLDIAGEYGIEVPYSEDFQDYEKAKEFLEKQDEDDDTGWCFKPEHNKDGIHTFVSTTTTQMLSMLDYWTTKWTDGVDFVLQKVQEGVEVSSEAWFVDGEYIPNSYNNTWEQKKFLVGSLGPNTGCMSSTVKFNACPPLYNETFKKLEKWIKLKKYTGPLDINCIVGYDGTPYMLEWTARMGYSAIYAFCVLLNMPISEFIETIANGKIPKIKPSTEWSGALRLTMPPYPHCEEAPEREGLPILGMDEFDHYWPLDVMMNKGKMECSGFDGIICEVTDKHPHLSVLWDYIYDFARIIEIPDCQFRTDAYEDVSERINALASMGICNATLPSDTTTSIYNE